MKDLNIKKEIAQIKKISLTVDEKSTMLKNLSAYADVHAPVSSPFSIFSLLNNPLNRKFAYVLASMIIAVLAGGSLAYASENSLPGDLLYPIKTKIVEPIKLAIATTPEAKAKVETEIADNRLQEAETLDKTGKLTPEVKKDLVDRFNSNVSRFNEFKKQINKDESSSSIREADKMQNEFDIKINHHNDMLSRFGVIKNNENAQQDTRPAEENNKNINTKIQNNIKINTNNIIRRPNIRSDDFEHNIDE